MTIKDRSISPPTRTGICITALIVTYNQEEFLRDAFNSVREQTIFDHIKVIISDDASTDSTFQLAQSLAEGLPNVAVRRNASNLGVIPHYRHIIPQIDTELVAILEGDDLWHNPEKLEKQSALFHFLPALNGSFTGHTVITESSGHRSRHPLLLGGERSGFAYFEDILQDNPGASFSNCMYRTAILAEALSNDITLVGYDWLVNLLIADHGPFGYLEGDYASYRVRTKGTWSQMEESKKLEMKMATISAVADYVGPRHRAIIQSLISTIMLTDTKGIQEL
ncbi:glycosyltransferase family 2 protein [Pseudochelatococcus sp. G4_1912]|uniref:glycosyltransferase family 2 protein n=1 Tax=Pseudochelatococcus sp. G4_1912 TaxID=3114288 RepID=UPI0039C67DD4